MGYRGPMSPYRWSGLHGIWRKSLELGGAVEGGQASRPRIGILLYRDAPLIPLGFTMQLSAALVEDWLHRKMQSFLAETAAVPVALALVAADVQHRDVLLFCDNEAACSALIRGTSTSGDVALLSELAHALQLQLACRLWIDWVDSRSNPADWLSRDGVHDDWTVRQGYHLAEVQALGLPTACADIFRWCELALHWTQNR